MDQQTNIWHSFSVKETIDALIVNPETGLSTEEPARRRERYGLNRLQAKKKTSVAVLFLQQFKNVLIYILAAAATLSILLGEPADAIIIFAVVLINAFVGVIQEAKAENAIMALKKMSGPKALVRRGGTSREIDSEQIVPGDIIILETGRIVPCDVRLLESSNLKVDESVLTGESMSVEKRADAIIDDKNAALGDRLNMGYMSTVVNYGRGIGIAVATGMDTQMGRIAEMLNSGTDEQTPLQKKLDNFGRILGFVILGVCALMFCIGLLRTWLANGTVEQNELFELFLTVVSLAVAAIPEGLPAIVTVVLALGVQRMSRENAIIRKLPAVETLGSVSIICTDKTGTLTQNRMKVLESFNADESDDTRKLLLETMVLCSDATWSPGETTGDPTEIALVEAGARAGFDKHQLEEAHPRQAEIPFDSERKMMSTINRYGGDSEGHGAERILTKGALEAVLDRCSSIFEKGKIRAINDSDRQRIFDAAASMAKRALRVLAAAYADTPAGTYTTQYADTVAGTHTGAETNTQTRFGSTLLSSEIVEQNLVFIGFVGMMDPPRQEVKESIAECRRAGITAVMITGDHKDTALAIAQELDIAETADQAIYGSELDNLDSEATTARVGNLRVFARVSPEHKVKIVDAFQNGGNVVSMTGDGVNDAPSLRAADIGVAMGITGTDVSKSASDMVLTDDNFQTIVKAVEEGRNIYTNIKRTVTFLLSCNAGEILAIFIAILLGMIPPLRPTHILWVNLITDTLPALALGTEKGDENIMSAAPRDTNESLFAGGMGLNVILNGVLIGAITFGVYLLGRKFYPESVRHAQTMAFAVLALSQLVHAFNLRHSSRSLFRLGVFSNRLLIAAFVFGAVLQVGLTMIPPIAAFFSVVPLSFYDWSIVALFALSPLLINEMAKIVIRLRNSHLQNSLVK